MTIFQRAEDNSNILSLLFFSYHKLGITLKEKATQKVQPHGEVMALKSGHKIVSYITASDRACVFSPWVWIGCDSFLRNRTLQSCTMSLRPCLLQRWLLGLQAPAWVTQVSQAALAWWSPSRVEKFPWASHSKGQCSQHPRPSARGVGEEAFRRSQTPGIWVDARHSNPPKWNYARGWDTSPCCAFHKIQKHNQTVLFASSRRYL